MSKAWLGVSALLSGAGRWLIQPGRQPAARTRLVCTVAALLTLALPLLLWHPWLARAQSCPTPVGTANLPPTDPEPTLPIWCNGTPSASPLTGTTDGFGGWIDPFNNTISGTSPARLNDGEGGYHTYEGISAGGGTSRSQHWEANGYFVADMTKGALDSGTDLSPLQSFRFQGGKLVLEGDVAVESAFASSSGADIVWPEMVWSTTPAPSAGTVNDNLYLYGYFQGAWASGCRLQARRSLTCAVEANAPLASTTGDQAPCWSAPPARVMEISGFQYCGSTHSGFSVDFGAPSSAWRVCAPGTVDPCLDRFRFEWTKSSFVAYVNGIKFAEDSGWPGYAQLPDAIVNGSTPIYAHFGEFGDFTDSNVYRFHWGRIAVNPHNADGTLMAPSASPTFGTSPTPTPTASPSPRPTPTPSPTPEGITGLPCRVSFDGGSTYQQGTCSGTFTP